MSHKSDNHNKGGKFLDGFFWGAVLGGGAAYVLSTKKGRDIVKELIQEGVNVLENMAAPDEVIEAPQVIEDKQIMSEIEEPSVPSAPVAKEAPLYAPHIPPKKAAEKGGVAASSKKRFFKAKK